MWLINECWSRDFNYAEYVSWHEVYATDGLPMATELGYVKACTDLDNEVMNYEMVGDV